MPILKKILYPFSIQSSNKRSFLATIELAKKENAEIICFTSVREESLLDEAFYQTLQLNGFYQTEINNWKESDIKLSRKFVVGPIEESLSACLQSTEFDYIISQPDSKKLNTTFITQLVENINYNPDVISFEKHLTQNQKQQ